MTPAKRRRYEKQLKQAREESMLVVAATTAVGGRRRSPARGDGNTLADCALIEREIDSLIAEQENDQLAAIDRALLVLRTEPEVFGRCEECGEEIPGGWLDIAPWMSRCVEHAMGAITF